MYRIWTKTYSNGEFAGVSVSTKEYKRKGYAERIAKQMFEPRNNVSFKWIVSEANPFDAKGE